jgi:hypothetical protein
VPTTVWAKVSQGKIELLEPIDLPEGATVLVTLVPSSEQLPLPQPQPKDSTSPEPDLRLQPESDDLISDDLIWDNIGDEDSKPLLPLQSPSLSFYPSKSRSE